MEISTLESFYNFLFILFIVGLVVFVALYFVDAGYGKMRTEKWGPAINNKVGWCLMEMPVFVVMLYLWAKSEVKFHSQHAPSVYQKKYQKQFDRNVTNIT